MYSFLKYSCVVVYLLALMIPLGVVVIVFALLLYGILHGASAPVCTSEVNTNASASIGVKSSATPKAGRC